MKIDTKDINILFGWLLKESNIYEIENFREFVIVAHTYLDSMLNIIIVNYFVKSGKDDEFLEFISRWFSFKRKLNIVKGCVLIPKKLYIVLDEINNLRNKLAHYIDWENEVKKLNLKIRIDTDQFRVMILVIFKILERCNALVGKNKAERVMLLQKYNEDFKPSGQYYYWFVG